MADAIYAIGDIHGQASLLDMALARIEADGGSAARVVFLGDYTDRGPDSRGVLDRLVAGERIGRDWVFLKGNHDRMFEWFMEPTPRPDPYLMVSMSWLQYELGGAETLASYGVDADGRRRLKDVHADARDAVPQAHVDFLRALRLSYETPDMFFAHAGIRPGVPLSAQDEEDLLWIRQEFHLQTTPHPKLIVHGHTPVEDATHYGNRVNLDSGAGYGRALSAAVLEDGEAFLLTAEGRVPLARGVV